MNAEAMFRVIRLGLVGLWLLGARTALAGDLNPPLGPVGPTMKPLNEVEPRVAVSAVNTPGDADSVFRISQPGSYYLTGNLAGESGKHGIEIAADNVTLDLMGFHLVGVPGSLSGITSTSAGNNVAIRNGSVREWGGSGIDLFGVGLPHGSTIESVRATNNIAAGIRGTFYKAIIRDCMAIGNGTVGIWVWHHALVESCFADENGDEGIHANGYGGTMTSCFSTSNAGAGIYVEGSWTIMHCSASVNGSTGIQALWGTTISGCTAVSNAGSGISGGRIVSNCSSENNQVAGIVVSAGGLVRDNTCSSNDGAGIWIGCCVGDARVEGNNVYQNGIGIDVDYTGNVIVRNTASANTTNNYNIVAGNRYGPIINITGSSTAAVVGNSAVSTMSTTDPWANFAY